MNKIYVIIMSTLLLSFPIKSLVQPYDIERYKEIVNAYEHGLLEVIIEEYRPKMSEEAMMAYDADKIQKNESINRLMDIVEAHISDLKKRKGVIELSYTPFLLKIITGLNNVAIVGGGISFQGALMLLVKSLSDLFFGSQDGEEKFVEKPHSTLQKFAILTFVAAAPVSLISGVLGLYLSKKVFKYDYELIELQDQITLDEAILKALSSYLNYHIFY